MNSACFKLFTERVEYYAKENVTQEDCYYFGLYCQFSVAKVFSFICPVGAVLLSITNGVPAYWLIAIRTIPQIDPQVFKGKVISEVYF